MERLFGDPENVDIVFFIRQAGVPLPSSQSVKVFNQLSDVETSALLRYPVSETRNLRTCESSIKHLHLILIYSDHYDSSLII